MQFEEESRTALYIYMLRSLAAFSVLQRRSTCVSAEFPEKISHVIISAVQADLRNRKRAVLQKPHCLPNPVLIQIFHWRQPDGFFEKTAEVLLVKPDQGSQVTDVYFLLVMLLDVGNRRLDRFHSVVIRFFCPGKKLVSGHKSEKLQKGSLDRQLVCKLHRHRSGGTQGCEVKMLRFRCQSFGRRAVGKSFCNIQKYGPQPGKSWMFFFNGSWKMQLSVLQRLDELGLNRIIKRGAKQLRVKDHCIFLHDFCRSSPNAVQFTRVNKIEAFRSDIKSFHINFHSEIPAWKIQNLSFFMPVMFYHKPMTAHLRLIKCAGKGLGPVWAGFF